MEDNLNFYFADYRYINFLQEEECKNYGDAKTPNMEYPEPHKPKFICGPLFKGVSGFDYYVPVSSYSVQKNANIIITVPVDRDSVKGSLRLNYMFPVPEEALSCYQICDIGDSSHACLLKKEFRFVCCCSDNIKNFAKSLYEDIFWQKCTRKLLINSCRMRFLENRCYHYCQEMGYDLSGKNKTAYDWKKDRVISIREIVIVTQQQTPIAYSL